jgi:hypothetical protein
MAEKARSFLGCRKDAGDASDTSDTGQENVAAVSEAKSGGGATLGPGYRFAHGRQRVGGLVDFRVWLLR